jgi:spore germination cell wall hydrolase CwlJ-like protein
MPINKHSLILGLALGVAISVGLITTNEVVTEPKVIEQPVSYNSKQYPQEHCLAQNIYHEARGSTFADRAAVADVTLNRVQASGFPSTICGVVKQARVDKHGQPIKNQCQFSWYCDGKKKYINDEASWAQAKELAWNIIHNNHHRGITEGATHYHTAKIKPYWRKAYTKVTQIGAHIYYKPKA